MKKNPGQILTFFSASILSFLTAATLLVLTCGNTTDVSLSGGNTSEVSFVVNGTFYEPGGVQPSENATVTIRSRNFVPKAVSKILTPDAPEFFSRTSQTDNRGNFTFSEIPSGDYCIEGRNSKNEFVFVDSIIIDSSIANNDTIGVPPDTLDVPCTIDGSYSFSEWRGATVLVFIPGLDVVDTCDNKGAFTLTDLPEGNYLLTFVARSGTLTGQKTLPVITEAGKTTSIGKSYHVTYSGNGNDSGMAPVDTVSYFPGDTAMMQINTSLARRGYSFTGWNTKPDGNGNLYDQGTVAIIDTTDIQLYAQWKINQYRVTFDSRGGSTVPFQQVKYGDTVSTPSPVRNTMVFSGWFIDSLYTVQWMFSSNKVFTDTTLYAKWSSQYEMKWIATKGKSFQMGEAGVADTVHTVQFFSDGYWIDTTEVTQSEYESVMEATYPGYRRPAWNFGSGPTFPVYNISWYDAVLYCNARTKAFGSTDTVYEYSDFTGTLGDTDCVLGGMLGLLMKGGFRLPTEAEWEYACRGGTSTHTFWGDDTMKADNYAWYSNNATQFKPVSQKSPNSFGLYDMTGNAAELCNDAFGIYIQGSVYEPTSPGPVTEVNMQSRRGGSWQSKVSELGSANRGKVLIYERNVLNGFRVCRSVK